MKKTINLLLITIILVVATFVLTGCSNNENNIDDNNNNNPSIQQQQPIGKEPINDNETITGHSLKMFANNNSCTIYFENGKSVKIDVEETLSDSYSEDNKEQYRKQKENIYGEATLNGNVVKYTITEDPMYIGQPRSTFTSGIL